MHDASASARTIPSSVHDHWPAMAPAATMTIETADDHQVTTRHTPPAIGPDVEGNAVMVVMVDEWFTVERLPADVTALREPRHAENVASFVVEGARDVAVLDTGLGVGDFAGLVRTLSHRQPVVLQSHGHWDHIGASHRFARVLVRPAEAYALRRGFPNALYRRVLADGASHPLPAGLDLDAAAIPPVEPTGALEHSDCVDLGGRQLEALHTPGHSPGGVTLVDRANRLLFPGDAVNEGHIWLFLPRSDPAAFRTTIARLAELAPAVDVVYPSHGRSLEPATLPAMRDAYEAVWAGERAPDRREQRDIGFPEPIPTDVFTFEGFGFLLPAGRYGVASAKQAT